MRGRPVGQRRGGVGRRRSRSRTGDGGPGGGPGGGGRAGRGRGDGRRRPFLAFDVFLGLAVGGLKRVCGGVWPKQNTFLENHQSVKLILAGCWLHLSYRGH